MKIAIIKSEFNSEITEGLLSGAREVLAEEKFDSQVIPAPGAFEIPLLAKKLAQSRQYQGVIALGCVIKGETAHFEYISEAASHGLMSASLETGIPMSFGILTTYSREQAQKRSLPGDENKGREAALACIQSIRILNEI